LELILLVTNLELDLLPLLTMHDWVSILEDQDEPTSVMSTKRQTSLIEFSSANDLSDLLGFSGERTRIVVNSRV
jgi:hypothetical protein